MTTLRRLDAPALVDFLRRNHRAFLFCRDEGGRPIGYAMRSITYEGGGLYFTTYAKSAKVRHLLAGPEVACVVLVMTDVATAVRRGYRYTAAPRSTNPHPRSLRRSSNAVRRKCGCRNS